LAPIEVHEERDVVVSAAAGRLIDRDAPDVLVLSARPGVLDVVLDQMPEPRIVRPGQPRDGGQ
jgi:hypothetical protein